MTLKVIEIPTNCPCCDYKLELVNDQLFCRNSLCTAQTNGKVVHFAKTLNIKGLGPSTVEKLGLDSVLDIYYLDLDEVSQLIGEKLATKLLNEIELSKTTSLAQALAAFSIPLVGITTSEKLTKVISGFDEISFSKCKEAGLGEKASNNLMEWFTTEYREIRDFLPFQFKESGNVILDDNKIVCITGKLKSVKTKKEAEVLLNARGYTVVDNLTKSVKILIDESDKISSKRSKAESMGIPIITNLSEFLQNN